MKWQIRNNLDQASVRKWLNQQGQVYSTNRKQLLKRGRCSYLTVVINKTCSIIPSSQQNVMHLVVPYYHGEIGRLRATAHTLESSPFEATLLLNTCAQSGKQKGTQELDCPAHSLHPQGVVSSPITWRGQGGGAETAKSKFSVHTEHLGAPREAAPPEHLFLSVGPLSQIWCSDGSRDLTTCNAVRMAMHCLRRSLTNLLTQDGQL